MVGNVVCIIKKLNNFLAFLISAVLAPINKGPENIIFVKQKHSRTPMNVENRPNLSIQIGIHCQVIDNWLIKTTIHFDRTA